VKAWREPVDVYPASSTSSQERPAIKYELKRQSALRSEVHCGRGRYGAEAEKQQRTQA